MSKEYKISVPFFKKGELETFDNNIHSIVEEYSKMMFKEKDQILTQRIIVKQEEELERLNNIINEAIFFLKNIGYDEEMGRIWNDMNDDECTDLLKILEGGKK